MLVPRRKNESLFHSKLLTGFMKFLSLVAFAKKT